MSELHITKQYAFPPTLTESEERAREGENTGGGNYLQVSGDSEIAGDTYMPRWMSEDGDRVFFDSSQPLVPQDTNGSQDVYEWEREGVPSCPSQPTPRLDDGCVFILSGGQNADFSYFVDAGSDGSNVFFITRARLAPEDANEKMDLYDARVDGGFPKPSLACTGTGCQGVPPAQPIFATPSSVTFGGLGNFETPAKAAVTGKKKSVKCRKGFVKSHGRCKKPKSATNNEVGEEQAL